MAGYKLRHEVGQYLTFHPCKASNLDININPFKCPTSSCEYSCEMNIQKRQVYVATRHTRRNLPSHFHMNHKLLTTERSTFHDQYFSNTIYTTVVPHRHTMMKEISDS